MEPVPEHCPGTESESAGKESACAGCPNQKLCASGETKGTDPDILLIKIKLANVKNIILVLSGKGGVGKTTVTATLAHALSNDPYKNVGVLDIDLCGPSIPRVMGLEGEAVHQSGSGWSPVFVADNLGVMSAGFLLASLDDAVIWRGPKKNGLIKQFLRDVDWGDLDYLLVDTPPGTSDEHLSIAQYLLGCNLAGAVVVTTPQEVSLLDVGKEINFCRKVSIPILGLVENMSGFSCPKCKNVSNIFPTREGGCDAFSKEFHVPILGKIPIDPNIGQSCDEGKSIFASHPESKVVEAYKDIVKNLIEAIGK